MKQVAGTMKLDLAQYREMAAFAQFSADLDKSTRRLLDKGSKLTELLKQPVHEPMATEEEVASIFSGVRGYLSKIEVADIKAFEQESLKKLRISHPEYLEEIREKKIISPELETKLGEFYEQFATDFSAKQEKAA